MPDTEVKSEKSLRLQRREARMELVRQAREPRRVRVNPRDENMRRALRHPRYGGFRSKGSIELPLDNWTKRRIKEGTLVVEDRESLRNQKLGIQPGRASSGAGAPRHTEPAGQ